MNYVASERFSNLAETYLPLCITLMFFCPLSIYQTAERKKTFRCTALKREKKKVNVCTRERERERQRQKSKKKSLHECVYTFNYTSRWDLREKRPDDNLFRRNENDPLFKVKRYTTHDHERDIQGAPFNASRAHLVPKITVYNKKFPKTSIWSPWQRK